MFSLCLCPSSILTCHNSRHSTYLSHLNHFCPKRSHQGHGCQPTKVLCIFTVQFSVSIQFQRYINLATEWKHHIIIPLFRKGDPTSVTNYRPISLLCSVKCQKGLPSSMLSQNMSILIHLLAKKFGFIPYRSCLQLQQLLSTLSIIYQNYSSRTQTDIIFLDFSKAIPYQQLPAPSPAYSVKITHRHHMHAQVQLMHHRTTMTNNSESLCC